MDLDWSTPKTRPGLGSVDARTAQTRMIHMKLVCVEEVKGQRSEYSEVKGGVVQVSDLEEVGGVDAQKEVFGINCTLSVSPVAGFTRRQL